MKSRNFFKFYYFIAIKVNFYLNSEPKRLNNQIEAVKRYGTCSKDCYGSCVFIGEWNDRAPEKKLLIAKPLKDHPLGDAFKEKFGYEAGMSIDDTPFRSTKAIAEMEAENT